MTDALDLLTGALRPGPAAVPSDDPTGWERVLRLAGDHDLLPAWWSAGVARGWWEALPVDALEQVAARFPPGVTQPPLLLQQAYEANRVRQADLLAQGRTILSRLEAEGITAVPLKGLHTLLAGWWDDPADRVMRDLDVLVPADAAERAAGCLTALGYLPFATGHTDEADHELPAVRLPERAGSVEVHTALLVRRWSAVLAAPGVLGRGAPMTTTDAVIHSIAHAQLQDDAHLLGRLPLRSLHELAVLSWGARADEVDWVAVRVAFRRASAEAALDAHLDLARSLLGAAVPPPRGALRARVHAHLCRSLVANPPIALVYEQAVFLPRALSDDRMHRLYGPGSPWSGRIRHVGRALTGRRRPECSVPGGPVPGTGP